MAGFYSLVDMKNVKGLGKRGREESDEEETTRKRGADLLTTIITSTSRYVTEQAQKELESLAEVAKKSEAAEAKVEKPTEEEFRRQVQKMLDSVFAIRYCGGSTIPPRGLTNEFEKYMTDSGFGDKLSAIHVLCNTVRCIYNKVLCSGAATTTALEEQRRSCIDELLASIANLCQ